MSCPIMIRLKMPQGTINQHSACPNSMTIVLTKQILMPLLPFVHRSLEHSMQDLCQPYQKSKHVAWCYLDTATLVAEFGSSCSGWRSRGILLLRWWQIGLKKGQPLDMDTILTPRRGVPHCQTTITTPGNTHRRTTQREGLKDITFIATPWLLLHAWCPPQFSLYLKRHIV